MLVLRLLLMVLAIICLMDGHAEVSSSTTGIRDRGESPAAKQNESEEQILDRKKKKKSKKSKKPVKKKKPKPNKPKPKPAKPVKTTPTMTTSTLKTTTILTTPTTNSPTTTATTFKTTTSTASTTEATSSTASTTTATTTIPTTTTTTTATTSSLLTTAATTAESGAEGECKATNGKPCIFPFKDGETEYNECKNHGGTYFWCATSVYDSGKYKHWSYCPKDGPCPLEGDGECRATNNKPCVFPFKDGKKEYNECADHGGKYFWCATGTNSAGKYTAWSKCPKDGSCPLPQKSTTPAMTSTATAASTTPLTIGTTAATDQMEEKVLDTLENLVLGESRDDSLQMVHMLHKKLDSIIKDLEGETSKTELSHSNDIPPQSGKLNQTIKRGQDDLVREGTELGEGLMFVLSTVDSMKSVGRLSGDCCQDCTSKYPDTELAEYWETLDTCYCYKKFKNPDVEPKTRASSKFSTKACATEQSGCGYNSNVDPDRLLAEQNSAYLMNFMVNSKDVNVFEVLNWNYGFGNPKIDHKVLENMKNKHDISSGYYMFFLTPASIVCDGSTIKNHLHKLFPIHMNTFSNTDTIEHDLVILVNTMNGEASEWMFTVFPGVNPKVCIVLEPIYFLVAMNRVQTITALFNFAMESGRYFKKMYPHKKCSTESSTIFAMKNIVKESEGEIGFETSKIEKYEWEAVLPIKIRKISVNHLYKTCVSVETKIGTAKENDFISYKGPVVFGKGQNTAVIFIHIKMAEEDEEDETFSLILKTFGNTSGGNNVIDNIIIFLKQSLEVLSFQEKNDKGDNYHQLRVRSMFEAMQMMSASPFRMIKSDIDSKTIEHLLKWSPFGIRNFLEIQSIQRGQNIPLRIPHGIVVMASKPNQIFRDVDEQFGQQLLRMGTTIPRNAMLDSNAFKHYLLRDQAYVPWVRDAIVIRKLIGEDWVFTAQLSSCGVRLFKILSGPNKGTWFAHENGFDDNFPKSDHNYYCLSDDEIKLRLKYGNIIEDVNEVEFIDRVQPSQVLIPNDITGIASYPLETNFGDQVGRAAALAFLDSDESYKLVSQQYIEGCFASDITDPEAYDSALKDGVIREELFMRNPSQYINQREALLMRPFLQDKNTGEFLFGVTKGNGPLATPQIHRIHNDIQRNIWKYSKVRVVSVIKPNGATLDRVMIFNNPDFKGKGIHEMNEFFSVPRGIYIKSE